MEIRGVIKPRKGSSVTVVRGSIASASAVTPIGAPRVTMFVKSLDCYDIESVFAGLHLSPTEARELAERLLKHADEAETLAAAEVAGRK